MQAANAPDTRSLAGHRCFMRAREGRGDTGSDRRFLVESGAFTPREFSEVQAAVARGDLETAEARTRSEALQETLTAEQVSERLSLDADRVAHLTAEGALFAFRLPGGPKYPTWQFVEDGERSVLPYLRQLADAFPPDLHPASIRGFMRTSQADLRLGGIAVSPTEWLSRGGRPEPIVQILDSYLRG